MRWVFAGSYRETTTWMRVVRMVEGNGGNAWGYSDRLRELCNRPGERVGCGAGVTAILRRAWSFAFSTWPADVWKLKGNPRAVVVKGFEWVFRSAVVFQSSCPSH